MIITMNRYNTPEELKKKNPLDSMSEFIQGDKNRVGVGVVHIDSILLDVPLKRRDLLGVVSQFDDPRERMSTLSIWAWDDAGLISRRVDPERFHRESWESTETMTGLLLYLSNLWGHGVYNHLKKTNIETKHYLDDPEIPLVIELDNYPDTGKLDSGDTSLKIRDLMKRNRTKYSPLLTEIVAKIEDLGYTLHLLYYQDSNIQVPDLDLDMEMLDMTQMWKEMIEMRL